MWDMFVTWVWFPVTLQLLQLISFNIISWLNWLSEDSKVVLLSVTVKGNIYIYIYIQSVS